MIYGSKPIFIAALAKLNEAEAQKTLKTPLLKLVGKDVENLEETHVDLTVTFVSEEGSSKVLEGVPPVRVLL